MTLSWRAGVCRAFSHHSPGCHRSLEAPWPGAQPCREGQMEAMATKHSWWLSSIVWLVQQVSSLGTSERLLPQPPSSRRRDCNFPWPGAPGSQAQQERAAGLHHRRVPSVTVLRGNMGGDEGCIQSLAGAWEASGSGHGEATCLDSARVSFIREEGWGWGLRTEAGPGQMAEHVILLLPAPHSQDVCQPQL